MKVNKKSIHILNYIGLLCSSNIVATERSDIRSTIDSLVTPIATSSPQAVTAAQKPEISSSEPGEVKDLFLPQLLKNSDVDEYTRILQECVSRGDHVVLNSAANNLPLISQLLAIANNNPARANTCLSTLKILNSAAKTVTGASPITLQIACQSLKYLCGGLQALIKKANGQIEAAKKGELTWHGNNVVHLAVKHCSPKLTSWCIMNCYPTVFVQQNSQGYTPYVMATLKKRLIENKKDDLERKKETLIQRNAEREKKGKSPKKYDIQLTIVNENLKGANKKLVWTDSIITMLSNAEEFNRSLSAPSMPSQSLIDKTPSGCVKLSDAVQLMRDNAYETLTMLEVRLQQSPAAEETEAAKRELCELISLVAGTCYEVIQRGSALFSKV
ncbi:MAG: hypothetical protein LBD36_01050 [Holosporales bacterium]|jgi:hypothetical protein|nr:hypothetical protein [Holosporales bacterium]